MRRWIHMIMFLMILLLVTGCAEQDPSPISAGENKIVSTNDSSMNREYMSSSNETEEKDNTIYPEEEIPMIEFATGFTEQSLGIASNTSEARSAAFVKGSDGKFYAVLPSRGFLVCIDLHTKEYSQHMFEDNENGYPYKSFASQAGKFYTGANQYFYEFDPVTREFTTVLDLSSYNVRLVGWGFCEDDEGIIYFSNHPKLYLFAFDPETKKIERRTKLDDTQMYAQTQAADSSGWVYTAIGTASVNVIGYHTKTGQVRTMFPKFEGTGGAVVYRTMDGRVVARVHVAGKSTSDHDRLDHWWLLENGEIGERVTSFQHAYNLNYPWTLHHPYKDAPMFYSIDYPARKLMYRHPDTKRTETVTFDYDCQGAACSPIVLGPDGLIYGTTNHPMNLFTIDPTNDTVTDHGISSIGRSVGNICAYAMQQDILVGAAYAGGYIFRIDTNLGIVSDQVNVSPRQEAVVAAIFRPRCALALSDGKTVLFSGYGGYGVVGAGLAMYNVETGRTTVLENKDMLQYHGILGMAQLPEGGVIMASTVLPQGGALPVEDTAALFEFDPNTKAVSNINYPFRKTTEISHIVWAGRAIHGITNDGIYFAYDPYTQSVLHDTLLLSHGHIVRQGMLVKEDGSILVLMSQALLQINPYTYEVHTIGRFDDPATSGLALYKNALYYCSGSIVKKVELHFQS